MLCFIILICTKNSFSFFFSFIYQLIATSSKASSKNLSLCQSIFLSFILLLRLSSPPPSPPASSTTTLKSELLQTIVAFFTWRPDFDMPNLCIFWKPVEMSNDNHSNLTLPPLFAESGVFAQMIRI